MSAPTKCEQCGTKGTYAIQVPCVMGCGGLMYYDKPAVSPSPPPGLREALETIARKCNVGPAAPLNRNDPAGNARAIWYNVLCEVGAIAKRALAASPVAEEEKLCYPHDWVTVAARHIKCRKCGTEIQAFGGASSKGVEESHE